MITDIILPTYRNIAPSFLVIAMVSIFCCNGEKGIIVFLFKSARIRILRK